MYLVSEVELDSLSHQGDFTTLLFSFASLVAGAAIGILTNWLFAERLNEATLTAIKFIEGVLVFVAAALAFVACLQKRQRSSTTEKLKQEHKRVEVVSS